MTTIPRLPPELDSVLRHGGFSCGADAYDTKDTGIIHYHNDRVLLGMCHGKGVYRIGLHSPLHPERGLIAVPNPPIEDSGDDEEFTEGIHLHERRILFGQDGYGVAGLFAVSVKFGIQGKVSARVYTVRDDEWRIYVTVATQLPDVASVYDVVMVQGRIFIAGGTPSTVLVLDVMSSSFYTIPLPDGVICGDQNHDVMFGRAGDDSGVYIAEMKEPLLQLRIWLHKVGTSTGWTLVDR
uniref:F-box protein AT5G49610-like beta-propeller domain-containing protein n=1 Tax=Leersia perrieri TaxID=77586 RepID=A0A0D9VEZ0_9ORYZ